jgi:peptide/nickel transport system permease protein
MVYVVKRLLWTIPVLLGVTLVTFAIIKFTPGDPVLLMLGQRATEERVAELRDQLGLDDPVLIQYGNYVVNAIQLDLGTSIRSQTPVMDEIILRAPSTFELTFFALLFAILFGIPAGVIAATSGKRWLNSVITVIALIGLSVPNYWFGIIALSVFAVELRWVSVLGGQGIKDLILPVVALGLPSGSVLMRLTRNMMLETLSSDYVRTAMAKGLPNYVVIWKHVLRNALIPVITALGLQAGALLGGTVLIESVFARPGLGRYAVTAILNRDFPQVQGMILFSAVIYVIINLIVDLAYSSLDPRIRHY